MFSTDFRKPHDLRYKVAEKVRTNTADKQFKMYSMFTSLILKINMYKSKSHCLSTV